MYGTLISSVTVGSGGASSIDFTSIPSTYTDLCLIFSSRVTSTDGSTQLSFNGSGSTFSGKKLRGTGGSASSSNLFSNYVFLVNNSNLTASTFSNTMLYIPNYSTSSNKSFSIDTVNETNASSGDLEEIFAGEWSTTSAINQITLTPASNFVQYTTAYLYGLTKGDGGATVS